MSRAINYLGIAKKAGALVTGEENSGMAIRAGKAKLLALASDTADNAIRRADNFVYGTDIPLVKLPITKEEISMATGKNGCSMFVLTDIGFANSFASALEQEYGDTYAMLASAVKAKFEKAERRKKEAKAHERNKKLGKRRTNG